MTSKLLWLLGTSSLLGLFMGAEPSYAAGHGTMPPSAARCPHYAAFPDDLCAQAPADGVFQVSGGRSTFFGSSSAGYLLNNEDLWTAAQNYPASIVGNGIARQSGQAAYPVAALPAWDMAGVDFPVGYSQTAFCGSATCGLTTPGKAPSGMQTDPKTPGCTYEPAGNEIGGPQVECGGSGTLDIEGYDFSGQTGPDGCTKLKQDTWAGYTGTTTIKNNKFGTGVGCSTSMLGRNDATGAHPNANSPGGAYVTAYAGDIFQAYVLSGTQTLCVTSTTATGDQGSVEIGSGPKISWYNLLDDPNYNGVFGSGGYYLTGPSSGSCPSGGTPYPLNQVPVNYLGQPVPVGSPASPVTIYEESFNFVVTSIKPGGFIGIGQAVQFDNNDLPPTWYGPAGTSFPKAFRVGYGATGGGDNIVTCPGGCPSSSIGTYTLSWTEVSPPQGYTTGSSVSALVDIPNQNSAIIDFEQNYIDGDYIQYPMTFSSGFALLLGMSYPGTGSITFRNNAIIRIPGRVFSTPALYSYFHSNYWEGFMKNDNGGHAEIGTHGPYQGWGNVIEYVNNTVLGTGDEAAEGTGTFFLTNFHGNSDVFTRTRYNTIIVNRHTATNDLVMGNGVIVIDDNYYPNADFDHNAMDAIGANVCFSNLAMGPFATQAVQDSWLTNNGSTNINLQDNQPIVHWGVPCP